MLVRRGVHWDVTVDVVIIGYGCAGAVAAINARDEGADVLILEKQPLIRCGFRIVAKAHTEVLY